ncbi:MAG: response regulator transcription factor [Alphaproteobacteria bacterium]|nr:response regulator transcription factor [Alphaproteobacteria bacterium]
MYVLVVEDDARIREFLEQGLASGGHTVDTAADGREGLGLLCAHPYDVAIVDRMLPVLEGLDLVRTARGRGVVTPILVLSAKSAVEDRVAGLQAGADDYLTKPYSFVELEARLQALHRRAGHTPDERTSLEVGPLVLDRLTRTVHRGTAELELQPREYALLEYLMLHPGQVVSKATLLDRIWGIGFDPQTNVVDVLVSRLRAKVDKPFERPMIRTRRGMGYVLDAPR